MAYYQRKSRRPNKKKRVRRRRKAKIPLGIMPTNSKVVKLVYKDDWTLNAVTADIAYQAYFSACSLYDPDRTGVGHQPKNFDQMAQYYQHYTVLGAKLSIRGINAGGTDVPMMVFAIKTDSIAPSNLASKNQLLEAAGSKYMYLGKDGKDSHLTSTYSKKKTWGKSATDKLTATTTASPADEIFWQVSAINTKSGQIPDVVPIIVTIEYIALFTERIQLDVS